MDITKLSPINQWQPDYEAGCIDGILTMTPHGNVNTIAMSGETYNRTNLEAIALMMSDLDVRQRRGWSTEKCYYDENWKVPQLDLPGCYRDYTEEEIDRFNDAKYQHGHDVGLLTKAEVWHVANIESKEKP